MSFIGKCYNGHKISLDDELEGETVECPICEEDFIASSNFEEIVAINKWNVKYPARGYIHMVVGLIIGGILTYFIMAFSKNSSYAIWNVLAIFSLIMGGIYLFRGLYELFWEQDPFRKVISVFWGVFYVLWKKIKFYKR